MPSKRILLMYISEVSGHRNAAEAIEKAVKLLSPESETLSLNAFQYTNPISEKIINRLYMGVIKKVPQVWDYLYDNPQVVKKLAKIKEAVHKNNSPKLKKLFDNFKPDVVVCTQAFPCGMVADFKKTYNSGIKLAAVLTDYIPHAYWIYDKVDYYITPSDEVTMRMIEKGVEPEKIKTYGIPFDHKFNQNVEKSAILRKLGLGAQLPVILIMGGGQGLGPIKDIAKLLDKSERNFQEVVVAGSNKKLYAYLAKRVKKYKKKVLAFGYADNINELMAVADIIVTKPGGITTAEALAKKLPMIIVNPIPGQEANNAAYLTQKGAAVQIDKTEDINLALEELLQDSEKLSRMRNACDQIAKPNASLDIARLLLS